MSETFGRPFNTDTGWRFGASIGGQFSPLGYCVHCPGHATPQDAMAHYQEFQDDKRGGSLAIANAAADLLAPPSGFTFFGDALKPRTADVGRERHCRDCGATLPNDEHSPIPGLPWERCDTCQERVAAAGDVQQAIERMAHYGKLRDALWRNGGVPDKYRSESFDTFRLDDVSDSIRTAYEIAADWAHWFDMNKAAGQRGLLFYGTVGVGKTHLSASIARKVIENLVPQQHEVVRAIREEREMALKAAAYDPDADVQRFFQRRKAPVERFTVTFAVAPELLNLLVDSRFHREGKESEEEIYARLIATRLLIIDDLGRVARANQMEHQQEVWYRIFNGRYNNRLPVIVTTNLKADALHTIVGEAVADRMQEMFDVVDMTGESYRGKKRGE